MPLEALLKRRIAEEGPITVAEYMRLCLSHPEHGYYMRRDPFGARGDFVTAPEISQVFGELIGVWCAGLFQAMGSPAVVRLVELGPGRGTLMADLLRAARVVPGFRAAARVHLVETSPVLRKAQAEMLGAGVAWHAGLEDVPGGPSIVVANEFFDALPVHLEVFQGGEWHERRVGLNGEGQFAFMDVLNESAHLFEIRELSPEREAAARDIAARLVDGGGAALIVDYGYLEPGYGDTLQAVKAHGFADPLRTPGEADLTAHVDFSAMAEAARMAGAVVPRAMMQGAFLEAMGIRLRAEKLAANASPEERAALLDGVDRLIAPDRMGKLFKVMAMVSPGLAVPYPFEQEAA